LARSRNFKSSIDVAGKSREKLIAALNQHLADLTDLYSQTKYAHWNVKGPYFISLHELFDKVAATVDGFIDVVAERVTALGGTALGTTRMAAQASSLKEYPSEATDGMAAVAALVARYAAYAASVRAAIDTADKLGDADSADLFTEISRDIDKSLWLLEAHLQGKA
jgi:starvation-inducible DNA-binding protein